jgi:hypothetical protein
MTGVNTCWYDEVADASSAAREAHICILSSCSAAVRLHQYAVRWHVTLIHSIAPCASTLKDAPLPSRGHVAALNAGADTASHATSGDRSVHPGPWPGVSVASSTVQSAMQDVLSGSQSRYKRRSGGASLSDTEPCALDLHDEHQSPWKTAVELRDSAPTASCDSSSQVTNENAANNMQTPYAADDDFHWPLTFATVPAKASNMLCYSPPLDCTRLLEMPEAATLTPTLGGSRPWLDGSSTERQPCQNRPAALTLPPCEPFAWKAAPPHLLQ